MEIRRIRIHGPTRTVALPISYLRDLDIQDHEYVAITLENESIVIRKAGAQSQNPYGNWTPSWRQEEKKDAGRTTV